MPKLLRCIVMVCLALSVGGCPTIAVITSPADQSTPPAPVTRFDVKFSTLYGDGFKAALDPDDPSIAKDVTNNFQPAPAPGGPSSAQYAGFYSGGSQNVIFPLFAHHLQTTGNCAKNVGICVPLPDDSWFIPPNLVFVHAAGYKGDFRSSEPLYAAIGSELVVDVAVQQPLPAPLAVNISEVPPTKILSINDQAPGTPLTVTIPAGTNKLNFTIHGVTSGPFSLRATAVGCQNGDADGSVK